VINRISKRESYTNLLAEAGTTHINRKPVSVDACGIEAAADCWSSLKSGENYLGYERTENFAPPGGPVRGKPNAYETRPRDCAWMNGRLSGAWTMRGDAVVLNTSIGRIAYRFQARDVHLLMGPSTKGAPVGFRLLIDGQPPNEAHGLVMAPLPNSASINW
jgi:Thioredoxin like C-terminal domain